MLNEKPKVFHMKCGYYVSKIKDGWFCPECSSYVSKDSLAVPFKDKEELKKEEENNNEWKRG